MKELMGQLTTYRRKINKGIFGVILICFFMPFLTLSCQSQDLMTLSGVQLGTGATMAQPSLYSSAQARQIPGEPLATLAIVSAGAGLATAFVLKHRKELIGSTAAGAVGAIVMLALKSKIDGNILQQGQGMIRVKYEFGFWLTFLLFVAATGLNGWELKSGQTSKVSNKKPEGVSANSLELNDQKPKESDEVDLPPTKT
jgi:hypothetical protein